jgi:hypothetical protein
MAAPGALWASGWCGSWSAVELERKESKQERWGESGDRQKEADEETHRKKMRPKKDRYSGAPSNEPRVQRGSRRKPKEESMPRKQEGLRRRSQMQREDDNNKTYRTTARAAPRYEKKEAQPRPTSGTSSVRRGGKCEWKQIGVGRNLKRRRWHMTTTTK